MQKQIIKDISRHKVFASPVLSHLSAFILLLVFFGCSITGVSGLSLTPQTTTASVQPTSFGVAQLKGFCVFKPTVKGPASYPEFLTAKPFDFFKNK